MKLKLRSAAFILMFGLVLLMAAVRPAPVRSEESVGQQQSTQLSAGVERRHLLPPPPRLLAPEGVGQEDVVQRPFRYWRQWANQELPVGRVFAFLALVTSLVELVIPNLLLESKPLYRQKWLRSFGLGCLFLTLGMFSGATFARMGLYAPLGTAVIAAVQLVSVVGMAVAARSIGDRITGFLHLEKIIKRERLRSWISLWIGALVIALVTLIPGFGRLPRIGNRMLAFIGAAGTGAFIMTAKWRRH
ncbi:MAG TPA: hypothetical protein V6C97_23980 [Oculatellaceae cyanobacterium]